MTEKISQTVIKVSVLTLLTTAVLIIGILYTNFSAIQIEQQKNELSLAARGVELNKEEYFSNFSSKEFRITWIDSNGQVIYDSVADAAIMENHLGREEFKEAYLGGYGSSTRYSKTLSEKTIYTAKKLSDGTFLRISTAQLTIYSLILKVLRPMIGVILMAAIFSVILANRVSKKAVEPFNNLDLENPLSNNVYEELSPLLVRIDKQNKKIENQILALEKKNSEILCVTENVSDGIIMLNEKGRVISANKKVRELLNCKNDDYFLDFCRDLDYKTLVEKALKGEKGDCTIKVGDCYMQFYASTTFLNEGDFAVFLFIKDVTDEEKNQQMRREFTANVSHELKTPLASIMGSAEIIQSGIAKKEDIPYFAEKIRLESSRLLRLIEDIINLSKLDESAVPMEFMEINLEEVCNKVKNELNQKIVEKNISFSIESDSSYILGIPTVIYEIIYNLSDNSINYNKNGGEVKVKVAKTHEGVLLSVKDSGIGIAKEDLPHIFERFYRVDKSHCKGTGGTGLGLSIVKHAAALHKAKIKAESVLGQNTEITIVFPPLK